MACDGVDAGAPSVNQIVALLKLPVEPAEHLIGIAGAHIASRGSGGTPDSGYNGEQSHEDEEAAHGGSHIYGGYNDAVISLNRRCSLSGAMEMPGVVSVNINWQLSKPALMAVSSERSASSVLPTRAYIHADMN